MGLTPGLQLHLRGSERGAVTAEQVGLFVFDFSVAFELFRSQGQTGKAKQSLTQWHLFRGHRRVPPAERLVIRSLRMESPIDVVATTVALTATSAGAIWVAIQAIERICMFPLNRRKAQLEIRKLESEVRRLEQYEAQSSTRIGSVDESVLYLLEEKDRRRPSFDETERVVEKIQRRLENSPIRLADLDVEFCSDVEPPAD